MSRPSQASERRARLHHLRSAVALVVLLASPACGVPGQPSAPAATATAPVSTATPTATPLPALWIEPGVPALLRDLGVRIGVPLARSAEEATLLLGVAQMSTPGTADSGPGILESEWTYVVVAPFPTLVDGITFEEFVNAWHGGGPAQFAGRPLMLSSETLDAFRLMLGDPAEGAVSVIAAEEMLETAWEELPSWGIVPFEDLDSRWKVLTVDQQSPIRKDFVSLAYPLRVRFSLRPRYEGDTIPAIPEWPVVNRDPSRMTTLLLTGVTALVRFTAITMNAKGFLYPGRDIGAWLREADIAHISNEIPFWGGCTPSRSPNRLIFCTDPSHIQLLEDVGADVIELSGDHFGDYGAEAMRLTVAMYEERGMQYYGGGLNLEDAAEPLLLEHNGNRIAFLGCNGKGRGGGLALATASRPGAYPCDFPAMTTRIRQLAGEGYVVVSTFQWHESQTYSPVPFVTQIEDFRRMAEAGASIVSGSQAHAPQTMEFHSGAFVHYGLGNLFFDQMGDLGEQPETVRDEFLDRYTLYDGRLISVELLTAMLEDYSRPRPMTAEERHAFLTRMFALSGWISEPVLPAASPTVTLTPIALPPLAVTATP